MLSLSKEWANFSVVGQSKDSLDFTVGPTQVNTERYVYSM